MNKEFFTIIIKRFGKGFFSVAAAFSLQFVLEQIPVLEKMLPSTVHSPMLLMALSAGLLALEKYLQGYQPQ